jgi:hypothetical protein
MPYAPTPRFRVAIGMIFRRRACLRLALLRLTRAYAMRPYGTPSAYPLVRCPRPLAHPPSAILAAGTAAQHTGISSQHPIGDRRPGEVAEDVGAAYLTHLLRGGGVGKDAAERIGKGNGILRWV